MDSQQVAGADPVPAQPEVRHCSVCFAVIDDCEGMRRSLEGHCYCERCSAGFFKKVSLKSLRAGGSARPGKEAVPA